jgi:hypothetical protein
VETLRDQLDFQRAELERKAMRVQALHEGGVLSDIDKLRMMQRLGDLQQTLIEQGKSFVRQKSQDQLQREGFFDDEGERNLGTLGVIQERDIRESDIQEDEAIRSGELSDDLIRDILRQRRARDRAR